MKDDLTNKISGSIVTQDGFPLVVKVSALWLYLRYSY